MLEHLRAKNLGLLRDAAIEPAAGLTVISGETGAGKTLLLGALRLLMGEPTEPKLVGPFAETSQADGVFSTPEGEFGVSRVVPSSGRSRSYLDGVVVSAAALTERLISHIEVVGQHDQMALKGSRYARELLDENLSKSGRSVKEKYRDLWDSLAALRAEAEELGGTQLELTRELDLLEYQTAEIEQAGLAPGDDKMLEEQQGRLRNANEIREHLHAALEASSVIDAASGEMVSRLRKVAALDTSVQVLADSSEEIAIGAGELGRDLQAAIDSLVDDPGRLAEIEHRLNAIGDLKRKYGKTVEEVLQFGVEAERKKEHVRHLLARGKIIGSEVARAESSLGGLGNQLSKARKAVSRRLEKQIQSHLGEIALESATVSIKVAQGEPGPTGQDTVEILFASHKGLKPGPVSNVASGGELSRLILSLSLATSRGNETTLVFDEVDAGVGGATALAMAKKLADLAGDRQVLCVTHLPQVAAYADKHYVVDRDGDQATVRLADGVERLEELSRMIAGLPESDRGQEAARELLELAGK